MPLKKLQVYEQAASQQNVKSALAKTPATQLCLVTPVGFNHLFDNHPPLEKRIKRLEHHV